MRAKWNNEKDSLSNNPHNLLSYFQTKSQTHHRFSSCSNRYCCSSSWMNQIGLTVWDVTSRLKWNGGDYSAVCYGLIESRGGLQRLCSGLGRSGVKLNMKDTWPKIAQSVWCRVWWISELWSEVCNPVVKVYIINAETKHRCELCFPNSSQSDPSFGKWHNWECNLCAYSHW